MIASANCDSMSYNQRNAPGISFHLFSFPRIKLKEMGLPEDHPDKNGVTVPLDNLAEEVKRKLSESGKITGLQEKAKDLVLQEQASS